MAHGKIKLITFDVTKTLCKISRTVGNHYSEIGAMYGVKADETVLNDAFKTLYSEHWKASPNFGVQDNSTPFKWWGSLVKDCFKQAGVINEDTKLTQISNHLYLYFSTDKAWQVLPHVKDGLDQMKKLDVKIGAISNADERLHKILRHLALQHYFDFVLASSDVGVAKPDPGIFTKALELAGITADQAVHVGDHVQNDYLGSREVGWQSFLISNNKDIPEVNPEHIIPDIRVLFEKLKDM
ncbi:hypothetical protein LOTGIDRAFT_136305 [Lottia gigantea]|uniref:Haloacid dehalogenase-like hydrolase domain-containing protein 3 n=1 Tax=Lottia gigantea TaxID=225164 RepID=V4AJM9_LOTGI|nr:hypothetical protein LOTGIDRAFT_136305 [Lottia gigantea]ESP04369.1 hypothetical protein LOTGIDRAFT_136305 [Lottia gigantea]